VPEGCDGDGLGRYSFGKAQTSKKLQLNVDPISRWMAANNACDNLKMVGDFDRQGIADGLGHHDPSARAFLNKRRMLNLPLQSQ
jgi:hypothetical protein